MVRQLGQVKVIAREAISRLRDRITVKEAYLFGSYSQGSADGDSDIDIAVFSPSVENMAIEEKIELISRVQKEVGSEVEIHLFPECYLKEARPTNFYGHILSTGIVIE